MLLMEDYLQYVKLIFPFRIYLGVFALYEIIFCVFFIIFSGDKLSILIEFFIIKIYDKVLWIYTQLKEICFQK